MTCPKCGSPFAWIVIASGKNHQCDDCGTWYEEEDEIGRLEEVVKQMKEKIANVVS